MRLQAAYDVTLTHADCTVRLAPSFRAAILLEQREGGYVGLLSDLTSFKLATVHAVIRASSTCARDAERLIGALGALPLRRVQEITNSALVTLTARLINIGDSQDSADTQSTSKPIAWADFHRDLFKMATGWLGWSPEQTYSATIPEIMLAIEGHVDLLKATNGAADIEEETNTEDQRKANIAAGLDPDFDRAGLASLRGMGSVQ